MIRFHESLDPLMEPIDCVSQHPRNPNSGDVDEIVASILKNGMYRPIYAQKSTGHILAGNTTHTACLQLGAKQIPVVWLDVDDQTATRILLADNRVAELAHRDEGLLLALLDDLAPERDDLALLGTGYSTRDMDKLRAIDDEPVAVEDYGDKTPHGMAHKCPECGYVF